MDDLTLLREIHQECVPLCSPKLGEVANYIAPLAAVPAGQLGICLRRLGQASVGVGEYEVPFSIQSVAKVFSLALSMRLLGPAIWLRVGREPSGTRFNSLVQLEAEEGRPRNPMINAGALVVVDAILEASSGGDPILSFVREAAGDPAIQYDLAVAEAEMKTGERNWAMAHFLKSFGTLQGDPKEVMEAYCKLCSLRMSCDGLAEAFSFLANGGRNSAGKELVTRRQSKRINAVMLTCGVYDEAGDFAFRVGLPAKSGVGGGIVAVLPGQFVASVWSPALNPKGNSLAGVLALELLTTKTECSIF